MSFVTNNPGKGNESLTISATGGGGGAAVDDTPFAAPWNGVIDVAPSKNAVYDALIAATNDLNSTVASKYLSKIAASDLATNIFNTYIAPSWSRWVNGLHTAQSETTPTAPFMLLSVGDSVAGESFASMANSLFPTIYRSYSKVGSHLMFDGGRHRTFTTGQAVVNPPDLFWFSSYYALANGSTMYVSNDWNANGNFANSVNLYYIKHPGGGAFRLQQSTFNAAWTDIAALSGFAASPTGGFTNIIFSQTMAKFRVISDSSTNYIIGLGDAFSGLQSGFVQSTLAADGIPLTTITNVPHAIRDVILTNLFSGTAGGLILVHVKEDATPVSDLAEREVNNWLNLTTNLGVSGVSVVWVGSPPVAADTNTTPPYTVAQNFLYRSNAIAANMSYFDAYKYFGNYPLMLANGLNFDGTHPTQAGSDLMASMFMKEFGVNDILTSLPWRRNQTVFDYHGFGAPQFPGDEGAGITSYYGNHGGSTKIQLADGVRYFGFPGDNNWTFLGDPNWAYINAPYNGTGGIDFLSAGIGRTLGQAFLSGGWYLGGSGTDPGLGNVTIAGTAAANLFSGSGASLTTLNASQLTSGTVPAARMPAFTGDITTSAGAVATTLKNTGSPGTYVKTTFDAQGRETSGSTQIALSSDVSGSLPLANGGAGAVLTDPNANTFFMWDDTDNAFKFVTIGSGFTYDHATHTISVSAGGGGTVTATGGNLTANSAVLGAGSTDTKVVPGITSDGTSKWILGVAGTSAGGIDLKNLTSGTLTLKPTTGALGTVSSTFPASDTFIPVISQLLTISGMTAARTMTIPDANFTAARTDAGNTFTGHQTIEGVTSAGATGTGNLVFHNGPTFVSPTLGVATGTRLGLGVAADATFEFTIEADALGITPNHGFVLQNTTAAAAGAQQVSPAVIQKGKGWKTTATAASQDVFSRFYLEPVQGTANPSGVWHLDLQVNGGSWLTGITVDSAGNLAAGAEVAGNSFRDTGLADNAIPKVTAGTKVFQAAVAETDFVTPTGTGTLSNKRITARITTISSSATPTINSDNCDVVNITALAAAITSMTSGLTGTPNDADQLEFRIKDNGTARAITWGTSYVAGPTALPTTTTVSKALHVYFEWDAAQSKWVCMSAGSDA
jgi:hypothetical protein